MIPAKTWPLLPTVISTLAVVTADQRCIHRRAAHLRPGSSSVRGSIETIASSRRIPENDRGVEDRVVAGIRGEIVGYTPGQSGDRTTAGTNLGKTPTTVRAPENPDIRKRKGIGDVHCNDHRIPTCGQAGNIFTHQQPAPIDGRPRRPGVRRFQES